MKVYQVYQDYQVYQVYQNEKNLSLALRRAISIPGCPQLPSLVRICPRDRFTSRKKNYFAVTLQKILPQNFVISFVEVFSLIFTQPA